MDKYIRIRANDGSWETYEREIRHGLVADVTLIKKEKWKHNKWEVEYELGKSNADNKRSI